MNDFTRRTIKGTKWIWPSIRSQIIFHTARGGVSLIGASLNGWIVVCFVYHVMIDFRFVFATRTHTQLIVSVCRSRRKWWRKCRRNSKKKNEFLFVATSPKGVEFMDVWIPLIAWPSSNCLLAVVAAAASSHPSNTQQIGSEQTDWSEEEEASAAVFAANTCQAECAR